MSDFGRTAQARHGNPAERRVKRSFFVTVFWIWLTTISILAAPVFGVTLSRAIEESRLNVAPQTSLSTRVLK